MHPCSPSNAPTPGAHEERSRAQIWCAGDVHCGSKQFALPPSHDLSYFQSTQSRPAFSTRHIRSHRASSLAIPAVISPLLSFRIRQHLRNPIVLLKRPFSLCKLGSTRLDSSRLGSTPLPVRSLPGQTLSTRDLAIVNPALRLHSARTSDATTQHLTITSLRGCAKPSPELPQPFVCSALY